MASPEKTHQAVPVPARSSSWRQAVILAAVVCGALWVVPGCQHWTPSLNTKKPLDVVPHWMQRSWAMLSPWEPKGTYVEPPQGCAVAQVHLLQRHGARHPSGDDAEKYPHALNKLVKVKKHIPKDSPLHFIKKYDYVLKADDLLPFGASQSKQRGEADFKRYKNLFRAGEVPFVRASGSDRVIDSSANWTSGFSAASNGQVSPKISVIIPEGEKSNNTLSDDMCINAKQGKAETHMWRAVFGPPIAKRLNKWAPGADMSEADVWNLMSICPIETQLWQEASELCALFTRDEWASYEYYGDLEKFYRTGYGEPLGPVQGVGYVNELLARLTNMPVQDHTQVNHTLASDPAAFPLRRAFYADFTHENLMVAVFSAMGLFRSANPLDPLSPDPAREWVSSRLVPFSARLVTEKLQCGGGEFVRMFLNDDLISLDCAEGRRDGMCSLEQFVRSQAYARSNGAGDWEKCFD